jgi:hypothetical protein
VSRRPRQPKQDSFDGYFADTRREEGDSLGGTHEASYTNLGLRGGSTRAASYGRMLDQEVCEKPDRAADPADQRTG